MYLNLFSIIIRLLFIVRTLLCAKYNYSTVLFPMQYSKIGSFVFSVESIVLVDGENESYKNVPIKFCK